MMERVHRLLPDPSSSQTCSRQIIRSHGKPAFRGGATLQSCNHWTAAGDPIYLNELWTTLCQASTTIQMDGGPPVMAQDGAQWSWLPSWRRLAAVRTRHRSPDQRRLLQKH